MKWPKPVSFLLTLILCGSAAALLLYETGYLPYRVYVVHTGSMYPSIPSESAVIVREHRYRVGDVVSFTEHGTVVSHRLMAIKPDGHDRHQGRCQPHRRSVARARLQHHRRGCGGATAPRVSVDLYEDTGGRRVDLGDSLVSLADLGPGRGSRPGWGHGGGTECRSVEVTQRACDRDSWMAGPSNVPCAFAPVARAAAARPAVFVAARSMPYEPMQA